MMEKTDFFTPCQKKMAEPALTDEQREQGRKALEMTVVRLLSEKCDDGLIWTGTQTDLAEMAYVAYISGMVRNSKGFPVSLAEVVRRLCRKLHARMPYSPYNVVARAKRRKGLKCHTFMERFCWLKYVAGVDNPLMETMRKMK